MRFNCGAASSNAGAAIDEGATIDENLYENLSIEAFSIAAPHYLIQTMPIRRFILTLQQSSLLGVNVHIIYRVFVRILVTNLTHL